MWYAFGVDSFFKAINISSEKKSRRVRAEDILQSPRDWILFKQLGTTPVYLVSSFLSVHASK
jgi:hypothetical protein